MKCPECGNQIPLEESAYNYIVDQVCREEVNRRVTEISEGLSESAEAKIAGATEKLTHEYELKLENARTEYVKLKDKFNQERSGYLSKIDSAEKDQVIAVSKAVKEKDDVLNDLTIENNSLKDQIAHQEEIRRKDIETLRARLESKGRDDLNALAELKDREIADLNSSIEILNAENRHKDEQIASLKDYRSKMSTKLLGESLEQHCEHSYDRMIKPVLKNAKFIKDTSAGEKGDYIYRETDIAGKEILSILFEMKTEDDSSCSRKKKNKDHFDKLDKDRIRRGCQIAVLVSTLEPDNDAYNSGITCVTEYEQMFVIRPQSFIDFIHLMRALSEDKEILNKKLEAEKNKSADIASFETALEDYRSQIERNSDLAKGHATDIVKQIDRMIELLMKHKEKIQLWQRQAELAGKKAEMLSLKSLAKGNETVSALIEDAEGKPKLEGKVIEVDDADIEVQSNLSEGVA